MGSKKALDDDSHIAELLAKDARESSIKYSALGLQAFLPKRPTINAPKPNTRFLQNIIRETDSHNAALKRKEEQDSRARLRGLRTGQGSMRSDETIREAGREKGRRIDEEVEDGREVRSRDRHRPGRPHREHENDLSDSPKTRPHLRTRRHRHTTSSVSDGERHYKSKSSRTGGDYDHRSRHHHHSSRRKRYRSNNRLGDDDLDKKSTRRGDRNDRHRHWSPSRSQSRSGSSARDEDRRTKRRKRSVSPAKPRSDSQKVKNGHSNQSASPLSDSDPLEALVGPLPAPPEPTLSAKDPPPLTSRGRGAYKPSSSAIDSHFASTYDPSLDLHPDSPDDEKEQEDWDMALEALRDRELWKRKGAERLREAGFGDDEVARWEKSGTGKEKGVEDVRWASKSEGREWDRGKVLLDDNDDDDGRLAGNKKRNLNGEVGLEAAWKPKKDGKGGGFLNSFRKALG